MLWIARAADGPGLFPIYTHDLVERFLTFDGVDAHRFSGIFRSPLESGDFFVYEVDGTVVGFCKATRLPGRSSHVVQLGPLAVSPQFHGSGYAAAMLQDVLTRLEHSGVLRFELQWRWTIRAELPSTASSDSSAKGFSAEPTSARQSRRMSMRS
jgi:GNAT superfamily N-acetyltransferase